MKWENIMLEYVREMGERRRIGLEHARKECKNRNKWRLFYRGYPMGKLRGKRNQV